MADTDLDEEEDESEDDDILVFCPLIITQALLLEHKKSFGASREITTLINSIQQTVKNISQLVQHYGLFRGIQTGRLSVKSYEDKSLLKKCESLFLRSLTASSATCLLGSSIGTDLIEVNNQENGKYVVSFVPLEGNSTLSSSFISGSIFCIFRKQNKTGTSKEDFMQSGNAIVASGYALYGPNTVFILAPGPGLGVYEFILDTDTNEFIMTDPKVEIPFIGNIYSINESRSRCMMHNHVLDAISRKKTMHSSRGRSIKCRYTGCTIADTHAILKEGGILISPPYSDFTQGMLKHQFFCNPLSFIVCEAGGSSSDGKLPILDATVNDPHQYIPLYMGSVRDLHDFLRILNGMIKLSKLNGLLNN